MFARPKCQLLHELGPHLLRRVWAQRLFLPFPSHRSSSSSSEQVPSLPRCVLGLILGKNSLIVLHLRPCSLRTKDLVHRRFLGSL